MFTLAEDLLLLALDDTRGSVSWSHSSRLPYALGGAMLMDLALLHRIYILGKHVAVIDGGATDDPVLDGALTAIVESEKRHDARHWVAKLGTRRGLKEELRGRLVERGILRQDRRRFLWVFPDDHYPTVDAAHEGRLRARIQGVVLGAAEPEPRDLLLLSLIHACNLTDALFPKPERKRARARVKELATGERFGKAVGDAAAAAEAAALAATTAATTAATSAVVITNN
jgi:hypothetical protein